MKAEADGIAFGTEVIDPFFHHLRVAELTQAAEEGFGGLAHAVPSAVGVDFGESGGQGAAAAQGDAEVMDCVGIRMFEEAVEFLERAAHPVGEAATLGRSARWEVDGRHGRTSTYPALRCDGGWGPWPDGRS